MGKQARAAIAHDWLTVLGGAERVAIELTGFLPAADLFTTFFNERIYADAIDPTRVRTWPLQRVPGALPRYRSFLPMYPIFFGSLDLSRYDLVLSSSVAFAHAIRTRRTATHISYIHTPARYAWDIDTYLAGSSWPKPARWLAKAFSGPLRRWDRATSGRPDVLIANSKTVQQRIERVWGRESHVIYPPVDVQSIPLSERDEGFLLVAARMLAYRRLDLVVEAATVLRRELLVVGEGPERRRLEALAGPSVRFLGIVDRGRLLDLFGRCHAYVVPGLEDFGIAPVEAMAAGKPVLAYGAGGASETVIDGETGVLFGQQTVADVISAIAQCEEIAFDAARIRLRAEQFSTAVFRNRFVELFERLGVDRDLYATDPLRPAATIPPP